MTFHLFLGQRILSLKAFLRIRSGGQCIRRKNALLHIFMRFMSNTTQTLITYFIKNTEDKENTNTNTYVKKYNGMCLLLRFVYWVNNEVQFTLPWKKPVYTTGSPKSKYANSENMHFSPLIGKAKMCLKGRILFWKL